MEYHNQSSHRLYTYSTVHTRHSLFKCLQSVSSFLQIHCTCFKLCFKSCTNIQESSTNKCKINVVTLTVLLIVKEASCEAYEHKKNCLLLSRHQQEPHWPSKSYKAVSINLQKKDSLHINLSKLKVHVYSKFAKTF